MQGIKRARRKPQRPLGSAALPTKRVRHAGLDWNPGLQWRALCEGIYLSIHLSVYPSIHLSIHPYYMGQHRRALLFEGRPEGSAAQIIGRTSSRLPPGTFVAS